MCERQAATRPAVRVVADLRGDSSQDFAQNTLEETILAVASLCEALHQQHARVEYCDAETTLRVSPNNAGLEPVLDRLAMIPYEGLRDTPTPTIGRRVDCRHGMLEIVVTADRSRVCGQQSRSRMAHRSWIIVGDDMEPVSQQWEAICREA